MNNDISNKKQHYHGTQTWIGLHPQALQTPYSEIYDALDFIKHENIETIVDIGAGYGRVGIVSSVVFPECKFLGFEIVKKRQLEANRVFVKNGIINSEVILKDVNASDFELPKADVYFIYDFSEEEHLMKILKSLSRKINDKKFYLITKGDHTDHLMKTYLKNTWKVHWTVDSTNLKIYKMS